MPTRVRQSAESRAEARRRARLAALGADDEAPVGDEPRAGVPSRPPGMLQRMFPMPPPLPGHENPLAGFSYDGPFGATVRTLYLLRRRPIVWIACGLLWALSYLGTTLLSPNPVIGTVSSVGMIGSLVAAGWFGWPRPWAYGAMATALGYVIFCTVLAVLAMRGVQLTPRPIPVLQAALSLAVTGLFFTTIGALAGFYGGYLRRRIAQPRGTPTARRR